jgi:hypothetical protein
MSNITWGDVYDGPEDLAARKPRAERIRVIAYSGGWAVMRGDDVIESHPELSVAILRQQQLEAGA